MSKIGIIDIGSNTFNLLVSCTKSKENIYSKEIHVGIRKGTKQNIIQKKTIKESMISISKSEHHMFSIPLEVNVNSGNNWGEAH